MIERRIEQGEESGLPTSVLLSRYRCDTAAMEVRFSLFKLSLLARAYNPNQPRIPAGEPDGGRWTDGGFHLLRPRNDPGGGRRAETSALRGRAAMMMQGVIPLTWRTRKSQRELVTRSSGMSARAMLIFSGVCGRIGCAWICRASRFSSGEKPMAASGRWPKRMRGSAGLYGKTDRRLMP